MGAIVPEAHDSFSWANIFGAQDSGASFYWGVTDACAELVDAGSEKSFHSINSSTTRELVLRPLLLPTWTRTWSQWRMRPRGRRPRPPRPEGVYVGGEVPRSPPWRQALLIVVIVEDCRQERGQQPHGRSGGGQGEEAVPGGWRRAKVAA